MRPYSVLVGWIMVGVALPALAMPGAYTDAASFEAAAPGPVRTVDFESLADGTVVSGSTQTPSGAAVGIVLPGPVADVLEPGGPARDLRIVADTGDNPANSGSRSLGIVDAGNFHALAAGTPLALSFTQPVDGFSLVLVTPEEPGGALFDLDVRLDVPGEASAQLSLAAGQSLGASNGREYFAYFLGVVGAAGFTQASLAYGASTPDAGFLFNLDDLAIAVPEPGASLGLLVGCAGLWALARYRRQQT